MALDLVTTSTTKFKDEIETSRDLVTLSYPHLSEHFFCFDARHCIACAIRHARKNRRNFVKLLKKLVFLFGALLALSASADDHGGPGGVTVPVPPGLTQSGILRMNSVPHYQSEGDTVTVIFCKSDANGALLNSGCQMDLKKDLPVDTDMPLPVGLYQLQAGASIKFIHITAGQKTVLNLQPIVIPQGSLPMHVEIDLDLTTTQMQDLILQDAFANNESSGRDDMTCKPEASIPANMKIPCQAMNSSNYHDLLNVIYKFNSDGTVSQLQGDEGQQGIAFFKNLGRVQLISSDVEAGTSNVAVSVFAGVYIVKYTNPATGESKEQFGITVTDN